MALALEFINIIIPRDLIEKKYPHGWAGYLQNAGSPKELPFWYDDYLLREGAMNSADISDMIKGWEDLGFEVYIRHKRKKYFKDLCVIYSPYGHTNHPCSWLSIDADNNSVSMKDVPETPIIYPQYYGSFDDVALSDD